MKTFAWIFLLVALLQGCGNASPEGARAEFWVRGNCDMCKEQIETALKAVPGVQAAVWNVDTKMASVTYDSTQVQPAALLQACAGAGHETKNVPHVQAAYDALPKCCKKPEDRH